MKFTLALPALLALVSAVTATPTQLSAREPDASLTERDDNYACFGATFSGADKWNAVQALFTLVNKYPIVEGNGAIGFQYDNSAIAYVCNTSGGTLDAQPQDVITYDNNINNRCGPSTAGRVILSNGIEYGRTAAGKPFCNGN